jgi:hypothetical protein
MRMRWIVLTLLLTLCLPLAAAAAPAVITREARRDVMLTIYNGNLGLVKDTREIRLGSGTIEARFMDVAALIDPTSVHLKSLTDPAGLRILEQNYEYDLLSSEKLMEKYVGRKVRIYHGATYQEATLLSTRGPIFEIAGQIYRGEPGQVVFPSLPDDLVSRPTLVWLVRSASPTPQRVEASYLTGGITWKADYVMILNPADTRADLTGWVTIDNRSGATYEDAALRLVAGDVHRAASRMEPRRALEAAAQASAGAALRDFRAEGFFEYHLYALDGRTTVRDNQTKQLALMSAPEVPVDKHFIYYGAADHYRTRYGEPVSNQKVGVYLEIKNAKDRGLGLPLPKGKVRVYKADGSGSRHLIGEDWIDHTPRDERVKIKMGEAFDVIGERTQKDWRKIASGLYEVEWEIGLRNHKREDVTVQVVEPVPGDWEVIHSSHPHEKVEAHTLRFRVPVPKDGAAKITYRLRLRF